MVLISAKNLTKTYGQPPHQVIALNNVSLEVKDGDFVAIIGPSGSGKSTLMHILGCLDNPSSGQYLLSGQNISSLNDNELAKIRNQKIGFVFQAFNLLPRTSSLKNVELPLIYSKMAKEKRKELAQKALDLVGLSDKKAATPSQLSGGQQQRVAIARALVNNPALIFADEPTGNLDTKTGDQIMEILKNLSENGKTVIIVTHNPQIADFANRIITLKDGQIIKDQQT